MKLEGEKAPPVQRHSAPIVAGKPEEPVAKHVSAALRQSAPASKVKLCFLLLCPVVKATWLHRALCSRANGSALWNMHVCWQAVTDMHACV